MCIGPEFLVAAALSGAGKVMSDRQATKNAQAKINAKNNALQQEIGRQRDYQNQNETTLNSTLDQFDRDKQDQSFGDMVAKRESAYDASAQPAGEFGNVTADAPQVVKTDIAKKIADGVAKSKMSAKALAKIGATSDLFQKNGMGINMAGNKIGTTNNLARGSLGVNQIEQTAAANNAGNKSSMFGDLLQAAGTAASIYTGMNGGAGAIFGGGKGVAAPMAGGVGPGYSYSPWGAAFA